MDDVMSGYNIGVEEDIKTNDYGSMVAAAEDVGIFSGKMDRKGNYQPSWNGTKLFT